MNSSKTRVILGGAAAVALLAACGSDGGNGGNGAGAGDGGAWEPEDRVTFVVPANAGGGQDLMARAMAEGFQQVDDDLQINVENRPGGSSAVGYAHVQQQEGDPEVIITATISAVSLPLTTEVSYTWESFTPIGMIAEDQTMAVVRDDSELQDLNDAVDAASDGLVRVGVAGQDGPDAVTLTLWEMETGVEFQPVVFQSGAESATALLAGDIDISFVSPNEAVGQLEAGDVRALAVFSDEGYPDDSPLADVPTAMEQGIDVSLGQLRGIFAAPGITTEQRTYWEDIVVAYTETEEYEEYVESGLMQDRLLVGAEFEDYLADLEASLAQVLGDE